MELFRGIKEAYCSTGGLSALAGSITGISIRLYNNTPPHYIWEKICSAPQGLEKTWASFVAMPITAVGALAAGLHTIFEFATIHRLSKRPRHTLSQTDSAYEENRQDQAIASGVTAVVFGLISTALKITGMLPSWIANDFTTQVLYGMSASEAVRGLAKLGKVGLAKTVSLLSLIGFSFFNLGFFAHTTAECQGIYTTYSNALLGVPLVAGLAILSAWALSKRLSDPIHEGVERIHDFLEDRKPRTLGKVLQRCLENGEVYLYRDHRSSPPKVMWTTSSPYNRPELILPDEWVGTIDAPNWLTRDQRIVIREEISGAGYSFTFEPIEDAFASSSHVPKQDVASGEWFYNQVRATLDRAMPPPDPLKQYLEQVNHYARHPQYLVIRRNDWGQPIWSYRDQQDNSLKEIPQMFIPRIALQFGPNIDSQKTIEICYNADWDVYEYAIRDLQTDSTTSFSTNNGYITIA